MDFDFGTLIYIILGIIYFIFTGATKNKKKQVPKRPSPSNQPTETVGPPPVNRPTFGELLEEFTTGKPATPKVVIKEPEPIVLEDRKPLVSKAKLLPVFEKQQRMEQEFSHFKEFEEEEYEPSPYAEMFRDMDATKKAFVASEIFKRKY